MDTNSFGSEWPNREHSRRCEGRYGIQKLLPGRNIHQLSSVGVLQVHFISEWNPGLLSHHHHKHQGSDPLFRSVSTVTAPRANSFSVFQLFSFLIVCSGMILKGFGFVAYFASVKTSSVCIRLSCLGLIHSFTYIFIWVRKLDCNSSIKTKKWSYSDLWQATPFITTRQMTTYAANYRLQAY